MMHGTDPAHSSTAGERHEAPRHAPHPAPATEYERLTAAFDRVWKRHDAFTEAAQIFADALTDAFGEFLQCPRAAIVFQPEDVDVREVGLKRYIPEEAIKLRKDGWFGFRVTVQLGSQRHISFPLAFRRSGDAWTVKLARNEQGFEITDALAGADPAFRTWVDQATAEFEAMLESFARLAEQGAGVEVGLVSRAG